MYRKYLKRWLDFVIVFCVLAVIWPILLLVTLWLHFANKGAGAFFTQERPGRNGKIFKVIKFKTMTDERDADGNLLPDAERLTPVGRFVRSTSIDELPQLINVLKGDMALIGPRPLLVKYLPLYSKEQARRHSSETSAIPMTSVNGTSRVFSSLISFPFRWRFSRRSFHRRCHAIGRPSFPLAACCRTCTAW